MEVTESFSYFRQYTPNHKIKKLDESRGDPDVTGLKKLPVSVGKRIPVFIHLGSTFTDWTGQFRLWQMTTLISLYKSCNHQLNVSFLWRPITGTVMTINWALKDFVLVMWFQFKDIWLRSSDNAICSAYWYWCFINPGSIRWKKF